MARSIFENKGKSEGSANNEDFHFLPFKPQQASSCVVLTDTHKYVGNTS